ncbi:type I restriction endonuclease subunit R [Agrococcus beijingensis]|uniref:type I restriction endonuclease subunit R n=1 Tax=Agrococcus beijingensis TaxID=3068634 RepID=UPI002741348E|nr:type I restriction endonuclease subunit R [Agrococcus sp. REN33]
MALISEATWEEIALETLAEPLGWLPKHGTDIAPGTDERERWDDPLIRPRLLAAMQRLNPHVPPQHLAQALGEIAQPTSQDAITENHRIHDILVDGYRLTYIDEEGVEQHPTIRVLSERPEENDWLAVNQVTVRDREHHRRFDVVLFVNGMPLGIVELKRSSADDQTAAAHAQAQTYVRELPMAFRFTVFVIFSNGQTAKYGTPFTPLNHIAPWNVDEDGSPAEYGTPGAPDTGLEQVLDGLGNQERFLQLVRHYTAFDGGDEGLAKRIAKPHQYFAVTKAVAATIEAVRSNGKAGVVWHTQGSGKSMEMELYSALIARKPQLGNPTIVVITDRNELDSQLFDGFARSLLLPERPQRIGSRQALRDALEGRSTGGILFTTLQKFAPTRAERDAGLAHPLLSERRNIVVVVDEAHRSHYDDLDGYARHLRDALPNATLIAFTGTPISFAERNTREVFGDYIDIYDLTRAVDDGATVPVSFEPRLIAVERELSEEQINAAADEATIGLDEAERAKLEASVAVLNAVYGAPERLRALAADIVEHWERRRAAMTPFIGTHGKALIVGATRDICARLYAEIVALRPEWHADADSAGVIKVVYSGTPADPQPISDHVRRDSQNAAIKERLKDVDDELELVIVKDMMLTGFDAPPLHTLYLDRPLKGALLMQTLARVNRTFRGKRDGLLVSYAPLVENLSKALAEYTQTDQVERPVGREIDEAAVVARTMVDELRPLLGGYDWRGELARRDPRSMVRAVTGAANHIRDAADPANAPELEQETRVATFRRLTGQLARAWALAGGMATLAELKQEIRFYEEVRILVAKFDARERQARGEPVPADIARLLGDLVAKATGTGDIVDIYEAAGIPRPSLHELHPEFIAKAQAAPNPQLAIEALRAMLIDESKRTSASNLVRQRAFSERIAEVMNRYTNQQLTSAEVIAELVELAKEIAADADRGNRFSPPLNDDELAFFDAVAQNESAVEVQGEGVLADIARELVAVMRRDVRTDWTVRDDVRAKLRSSIKRLLVKHGYPPDRQPEAIRLVMDQMESMAPRYSNRRSR